MTITDTGTGNATAIIRRTRSLCPVCLRPLRADLVKGDKDGSVWLERTCPEHGRACSLVWSGCMDYEEWISREEPLGEDTLEDCDGDCRECLASGNEHGQDTCCVILEVTRNCNLRCPYCFAYGGETDAELSGDELRRAIEDIAEQGHGPLIQFAGGEPTLRDDLPELVMFAREAGCRYTQINTNGIRLAEDEDYVRRLADAGLDIVFLQFDGADDEVYRALRGRDLLDIKLRAITNCDRYRIGVTLVPTIVPGINDDRIGETVRRAVGLFPAVRSIHFQPVTYLGRYPENSRHVTDRYTLDRMMSDLCAQTGIPERVLLPSRCDHAACEFHSTFMVCNNRQLYPVTDRAYDVRRDRTSAGRNREYVAGHWGRGPASEEDVSVHESSEFALDMPLVADEHDEMDFDEFTRMMKTQTFKISAMAFQDAMTIDLERLYRCSLHVYDKGKLLPFCAKYLTPAEDQKDR